MMDALTPCFFGILALFIPAFIFVLLDKNMRKLIWQTPNEKRKQREEVEARKNPAAVMRAAITLITQGETGDLSANQIAAVLEAEGFIVDFGIKEGFDELQAHIDEEVDELTEIVNKGRSAQDVISFIDSHFAQEDHGE